MLRELERAAAVLQRSAAEQDTIANGREQMLAVEAEALRMRILELQAQAAAATAAAEKAKIANLIITEGSRGGGRGNAFALGRPLKRISTPELSDGVRNELISRLPIREGDTVTQQSVEQTGVAVHSYDEHMRVQYVLTDDGGVEMRIRAGN